tara:strand:+ start:6590 stop:6847 length:258 start_codon:yes stop_codon:yes gene_type:complete
MAFFTHSLMEVGFYMQSDCGDERTQGALMWQVIKSVLAAFFGVQKEQQRKKDFEEGKPVAFIIVGLLMALVLVVGVFMLAMSAAD